MRRSLLRGVSPALIAAACVGPAAQSTVLPTRFSTTRIVYLRADRAQATFAMREHSGVILLARLTVPHGVNAFVDASIPHVAGARISSFIGSRSPPSLGCRRHRSFDVCTQGEEWCPMPPAVWHFHLVKLSGPAGRIRVDFVVSSPL